MRYGHDHVNPADNKHAYRNSPVWSGGWMQYMNLVGQLYSDPAAHRSYYGIAYDPYVGQDWEARWDPFTSLKWHVRRAGLEGVTTTRALGSAVYGNGAPDTLNINLGVLPNKRRPHWQHLDDGQDPAETLDEANFCGR